jgi:hypothetical protein
MFQLRAATLSPSLNFNGFYDSQCLGRRYKYVRFFPSVYYDLIVIFELRVSGVDWNMMYKTAAMLYQEKPPSLLPLSKPRFQPNTSRMQVCCYTSLLSDLSSQPLQPHSVKHLFMNC